MINNLRINEKNKICTVYHNYNLSTKNFDGNLLYQLFLSNGQLHKTQITFPKPQPKTQSRVDSRKTFKSGYKSQMQKIKLNQRQDYKQKSTKILNMITTQYQKKRQSTQLTGYKCQSSQLVSIQDKIRNKYYESLNKSMEAKRHKKTIEQPKLLYSRNNINENLKINTNMLFNNKLKRPPTSRKKQKFKVNDFFKAENIVVDPWVEGKLGGFSAQFISVISNSKRIYCYEGDIKREVASLTKIMTCITVLYLVKRYGIDIFTQQVKVSKKAALLNGTTADLVVGDILNLNDLLYAMMLPSGNDAAQSIADFFDKLISDKNKQQIKSQAFQHQYAKKQLKQTKNQQILTQQSQFISQMNKLAQHLQMKNTHFDSPHGLSNKNNYSTANDMVELCHYAMKNNEFKQIVKCKQFQATIFSSRQKMKRTVKWVNTNKLLSLQHCDGIKTGVTPTAGPCMAASFHKDNLNIVIVILNAKTKNKRFQEVQNLYEWAEKQIINCQT